MNKKTDSKKVMRDFCKAIDAACDNKKKFNRARIEKLKFACLAMRFVTHGEKLWRENRFDETHAIFRQGLEYIDGNLHILDKANDRTEYSAVETFRRDLKSLSEIILFDREFMNIFLSRDFKDLKARLVFLEEFLKKNISREFTSFRLQSVFVMKLKYLTCLLAALLDESFNFEKQDNDSRKSLEIFKKLDFKKAEESLQAIDNFLLELKDRVKQYGGLMFIPREEELRLMVILRKGQFPERLAYARAWTNKLAEGQEDISKEQYDKLMTIKSQFDLIVIVNRRKEIYLGEMLFRKSLKPRHFSILQEAFRNKGNAGSILDLLDKVFERHTVAHAFYNKLKEASKDPSSVKVIKGEIYNYTGFIRTEISRLNKFIGQKLKLKAELKTERKWEFKFSPPMNYLYIELSNSSYKDSSS